ncbi:MAG TPA: hypothetical protein VND19_04205 [Acetobacteraceae bacterium]|nr:hypothetical protein [Acetobacteraceae bacterium]
MVPRYDGKAISLSRQMERTLRDLLQRPVRPVRATEVSALAG